MKIKSHNSISELIFTIALFAVFLISGVLLVFFGAGVYQKTTSESNINDTIVTSLSYIQEKVRQCDHEDSVKVVNSNGITALALCSTYNDEKYITYIYYDNGGLKELFIKDGQEIIPSGGETITEINDLSITDNNSLINIILTDTQDNTHELYINASSYMN